MSGRTYKTDTIALVSLVAIYLFFFG